MVDNQQRADAATELTHAILYGIMGANPEDQTLTINADVLNLGTDADADVVMNWLANTNSGVITWMEDEDYFQFSDDVHFEEKTAFNTLTLAAAGPTDNLDVSGVNVVFIDTSGNNVILGGTVGGVDGQVLIVVVHDATNNTTIEDQEGTGNQDFYLHAGADETLTAEYGGWTFVNEDGTHWHDASHAKHV